MDTPSENKLALVNPVLATKVRAAADDLAAQGIYFRVAQGLRTYTEQDALYAQGRTAPGKIVTNAKGGYSQHCHGLAIDGFPFIWGSSGEIDWNPGSPQFTSMVAALKAQGLIWGGDWVHLTDKPHFQMPGMAVTPTDADRAAFAAGGLIAVWKQYGI